MGWSSPRLDGGKYILKRGRAGVEAKTEKKVLNFGGDGNMTLEYRGLEGPGKKGVLTFEGCGNLKTSGCGRGQVQIPK